ncbi:MAG: sulfatase [Alphaproteobacteria bacterium]|nr:sulfatase [Alphaproteobacteria bacterium]
METEQPSPPPQQSRSTLAGLVVIGALLGFVGLLFFANLGPGQSGPAVGPGEFKARGKAGKGKGGRGKAGKGKAGKAKATRGPEGLPPEALLHVAPPHERPQPPAGTPNVVVLVPTSFRKDHVSPYGADPALTPFLQDVATHGARFDGLVSVGPLGRYTATAMLTGQVPSVVDMQDPSDGGDGKVLADEVTTLPEILRDAGWRTYGVTANFHLNQAAGLAQGFDVYRDTQPNGFDPAQRLEGPEAVQIALGMIRERSDEEAAHPFYLQVDLVDAHAPVRDVREITEQFDRKTPGSTYRAAVHRTDEYLKGLWDGLGQLGFDRTNTFLMVVGDHGEGLSSPEHHGKAHGRYLYESSLDVVWLVDGPGVPEGRAIDGLASTTDVFPTLLELLGLPVPGGIDGRSWARQVLGKADRTTRERAFSDTWFADVSRASVRTERMACQKDFGSRESARDTFVDGCFDRKTDPDFLNVMMDDALMAELVAWRAEVSANLTSPPSLVSGPAPGEEVP